MYLINLLVIVLLRPRSDEKLTVASVTQRYSHVRLNSKVPLAKSGTINITLLIEGGRQINQLP